ncbi:MAG: FAD-binding oxidoreductase [Actinomycetota bacterium]|nr:FAD-binding oxidoreductase [Actinomycetota bacterium]
MACDPCGVPLVVAPRPACADQVMDAIAARLGVERASLRSPTTRPPSRCGSASSPAARWSTPDVAIPGIARGELRRSYDVVIVGAGIQGLALAYELTKLGVGDVCVLDAAYPGSGASGRNGELIRSAFNSTEWAGFFDASLRRWHELSVELDFNVLFTQAGYLVVATTDDELARSVEAAATQRQLGVARELVGAREVAEPAPAIDPAVMAGGVYQERGGYAHHDAAVWAYARAAARQGAEIHPSTRATGIEVRAGRVSGVTTSRGNVATRMVVDAAGGHAREVAAMAGVPVPTSPLRLEAFVTESLRPRHSCPPASTTDGFSRAGPGSGVWRRGGWQRWPGCRRFPRRALPRRSSRTGMRSATWARWSWEPARRDLPPRVRWRSDIEVPARSTSLDMTKSWWWSVTTESEGSCSPSRAALRGSRSWPPRRWRQERSSDLPRWPLAGTRRACSRSRTARG